MASIRLKDREVKPGRLPECCMKCGEPAEILVKKKFSWHPPWIWVTILAGVIVYIVLAAILTKTMTVAVPMCEKHRNHWNKRFWFISLSVVFLAVYTVLSFGVRFFVDSVKQDLTRWRPSRQLCAGAVSFLCWLG